MPKIYQNVVNIQLSPGSALCVHQAVSPSPVWSRYCRNQVKSGYRGVVSAFGCKLFSCTKVVLSGKGASHRLSASTTVILINLALMRFLGAVLDDLEVEPKMYCCIYPSTQNAKWSRKCLSWLLQVSYPARMAYLITTYLRLLHEESNDDLRSLTSASNQQS